MTTFLNHNSTVILIGRGFDAVTTVQWLDHLYQLGHRPLIVSTTGMKGSSQGLIVNPHILAQHIQPSQPVRLMVIPGTSESAHDVMSNERIQIWLESTILTWNYVAVMATAVTPVIAQLTHLPNLQFAVRLLTQGVATPTQFIQTVTQKLLFQQTSFAE